MVWRGGSAECRRVHSQCNPKWAYNSCGDFSSMKRVLCRGNGATNIIVRRQTMPICIKVFQRINENSKLVGEISRNGCRIRVLWTRQGYRISRGIQPTVGSLPMNTSSCFVVMFHRYSASVLVLNDWRITLIFWCELHSHLFCFRLTNIMALCSCEKGNVKLQPQSFKVD